MKKFTLALGLLISAFASSAADMSRGADNFYKSDKVTQQKVTFKNQYQMAVVGNLLCAEAGGAGFCHAGYRSLFLGRKRGQTGAPDFTGNLHR